MHIKDYCAIICLLGILIGAVSYWAAVSSYAWWKDAAQVGALMIVVAVGLGVVTPAKPRDLAAEVAAAERDANAAEEKLRHSRMLDAMTACDYAIKGQLQYPGSYSTSWISDSNRQFETAQGWEIYKAFEAKNGFGGSLPHVGHCSITRSGNISVEISRS